MKNTMLITIELITAILLSTGLLQAQASNRIYRIAKITIDSNHINNYQLALTEQMQAAIQHEPGVISYTAFADKKDPTKITIIEVYASKAAYQSHIETRHFKKYKQTVSNWVLSLELLDQVLIAAAEQNNKL